MITASDLPGQACRVRPPQAEYWELSRRLSAPAFQGAPLREFVADLGLELLNFTGADEVEFWLRARGEVTRYVRRRDAAGAVPLAAPVDHECRPDEAAGPLEALCLAALHGTSGDTRVHDLPGGAGSLLLLPFGTGEDEAGGGLVVLTIGPDELCRLEVGLLGEVARDLALAFTTRHAHASLRERMKELNCLYRMALVVEQPHSSGEEVLQGIVDILPEAWLHPGDAWVRLEVGDASYSAGSGRSEGPRLRAEIVAAGERRGVLEVGYTDSKPPMDEGPFLTEERALLATVAREVALIVERQEVAEASRRMQEQLQHAERLATIGELAAGIGHELNDPLNNILGYAQLLEKRRDLPEQVLQDLGVISTSALHARDVIRQLLMFARRMPQRRTELDLNDVVTDAYPFLRALCSNRDVSLVRDLAPGLPLISSDPDQMRQVLVNLVVNAAQAMPDGGRLTLSTSADPEEGFVLLVVEDTGKGMSEETRRNAFLPFYTTREKGTGLGLPVVHGIVTSHGGSIHLRSEVDRGSRFEILLPVAAV